MDELISINEEFKRLNDWHRLPEVVAQVQKINERRQRADYLIKASRENTEGGIWLNETIENVIWEKVELQRKYNEQIASNARKRKALNERWAAAVQNGPPAAAQDPFLAGSIPTPTRSSAAHESQDGAGSERSAIRDSQPTMIDDSDDDDDTEPDPIANDEQPTRSAPRRRPVSAASVDVNPPTKRTRRSDMSTSLTPGRSIEFDEVFQNGEAEINYKIVKFPYFNGHWYILECKDCQTHFRSEEVVEEAAKHWTVVHRAMTIALEEAIGHMGTQVLSCNAELAERNNALSSKGQSSDQEPPQGSVITNARKKKRKRGRPSKATVWIPPKKFKDVDPRIINAEPGDIVCQLNQKTNYFDPAMVLPWGSFERFGWTRALKEVSLNTIIPECYDGAKETDTSPSPWAPGYEDNGDQAHKRKIPVLYFRGQQNFPNDCPSAWVPLNRLKVYDENCTRTPHRFKEAVEEFHDNFREDIAREKAANKASGVCRDKVIRGNPQAQRRVETRRHSNVTSKDGRHHKHSHTRQCAVVPSIERSP